MVGVEAAGLGINTGKHAATLCKGSVGVLHGSKSYILQNDDGQIEIAHSISAGLDYPGVGPEHAYFKDSGRADYVAVTDTQALEGFKMLTETEGIIPALESSHALYHASRMARLMPKSKPSSSVFPAAAIRMSTSYEVRYENKTESAVFGDVRRCAPRR